MTTTRSKIRLAVTLAATPWRAGIGALRRLLSLHGRRLAVLWRGLAGPGRRVRLPRRSAV